MVIVDSSVWVDYFNDVENPETVWLDAEMDRQRLALTPAILCEVLKGVGSERRSREIEAELRRLEILSGADAPIAVRAAANYRKLRARGRSPRGTIDALIATLCIERGHALLHRDRDFDAFEEHCGLIVVHPEP